MRLKIPLLFFCATAWCSAQTTYASAGRMLTLEELMETTISVSTGTQKTVAEAPSIATVITSEQIARSSVTNLFELLDTVPGLFVYVGASSFSNIDVRGIHTNYGPQTILMINGTQVKRLQNGNTSPRFNLPTSLIERIEIIRGPGSAVYGADAYSGVINVITKDAKSLADVYEAGVRVGSFNSSEVFATVGTSVGEAKIGVNVSFMNQGNDNSREFTKDQQAVFDKAYGTHASNAPEPLQSRGRWLNLALNGTYKEFEMNFWTQMGRDLGTGVGVGSAIDPEGYYNCDQAQLDFYHRSQPADGLRWEQKLYMSYLSGSSYLYIFPKGTLLPIGKDGNAFSSPTVASVLFPDGYLGTPTQKDFNIGLESTLLVSKFTDHTLRVNGGLKYSKAQFNETKNFGPSVIDGTVSPIGGTLTDVSGTSYIYIPNSDRKLFFFSLQDEFALAPTWTLTAGVRDDYYSDFGNTINPRLALVWHKNQALSVKLLYGRAFRAPTFQELYARNNPAGVGNSNVKPETMDMKELGVEYQPSSKWHISANIYDYIAANQINTVPAAVGNQFANTGKQTGRGVETTWQYQPIEQLLLAADYAYRWTKSDATGRQAAYAPVHVGHARADWEFYTGAVVAWETQFVANTQRVPNDSRQKIGDYTVSNLSISYNHAKQWSTKFSIRNIFDKEYYYPTINTALSDIPAPGRSVYAQMSYRF
jgi:outer membrane receptor for ferrienterochelin and colicins